MHSRHVTTVSCAFFIAAGCASWEKDRQTAAPPVSPVTSEVIWTSASCDSGREGDIRPVQAPEPSTLKPKPAPPLANTTFNLPPGLPGAEAPPINLPDLKNLTAEERYAKIEAAYPALPPMPDAPTMAEPQSGKPYGLAELQSMALERNPVIQRATADVHSTFGLMIQAGLYPNPHTGYQADQIQPGTGPKNNAGQQGAFLQQLIKTCHKLTLARAVAGVDYANAQIALRRAQLDVLNQVRLAYFAVVVARETMEVSRKLAKVADEVYRLQLRHIATGEAAGYEPLQFYAQSAQARNTYIQSRNRLVGAWKQLAAALGTPDLPLQPVAGSADASLPRFDSDAALERIRDNHTDVLTALNTIVQMHTQLRLARVTAVPDIALGTAVQHDNSVGNNQVNIQLGFTLPVFDRNQGNIRSAAALIGRAQADLQARRNDLSARFAEAFARYQSSQAVVINYRDHILPNLSRAYRTIYERYLREPDKVGFNDIVVAQQNLGQALTAYLLTLGDQWTAVVDVANLLQIDDIYQPLPK